MTTPTNQQSHDPDADMWLDSALRPFLGNTYDHCRQFICLSAKNAGKRDLNGHYYTGKIVGSESSNGFLAVLQALDQHHHVVLTTRYAGLSLMAKYVGMQLSSGKAGGRLEPLDGIVPVYVDLASMAEASFNPLESFRETAIACHSHIARVSDSSLLSRLNAGKCLVILDNMDHISEAQKSVVDDWILEIPEWGNRLLITTRDFQRPVLSDIPVLEVSGNDMNRAIHIASDRLQSPPFNEFRKRLAESPGLQNLIQHPVLLDMALELCQESIALPDTEFGLAQAFLSLAVRTVKRSMNPELFITDRDQTAWLSRIGYTLHERCVTSSSSTVSKEELVEWMQEILGDADQVRALTNLESFLEKTSIFAHTRKGYTLAAQPIITYCASKFIEGHVVSPSFVLSKQSDAGITKTTIAKWAKNPARDNVLNGVISILKAERSTEWVHEFMTAMGVSRPTPRSSNDEVSP